MTDRLHAVPRGRRPAPIPDDELAEALAEASELLDAARAEVSARETRRNELVVAALAAGWRPAAIARVTGLTRERIRQLAPR